ncbi:BglG family transcription antiterminator [Tannockella kyphosi]|uniref:BglG family transcription antiterminator n=1 Tax=Tannockella kyphosi TaxID=2899121 RepID=UPI00201293D7|nr:PRD domain-containing protein [Tannockella kyphosi]
MNLRQKQLFKLLIQQDNYLTVQEMADFLSVSLRTAHTDLKIVEELLNDNNVELDKKQNVGIKINADMSVKNSLLNLVDETKQEVSVLSTEIRRMKIISRLLFNREGTSLNKLADEFMVSKTSIVSDFEKIELFLSAFQLELIRDRQGTRVSGNEKNIRHALSQLATNFVQLEFDEVLQEQESSRLDLSTFYRLKNIFEIDDIEIIENILEEAQEKLGYMINEVSYVNLITHLLILIKRLKNSVVYTQEQIDQVYQIDTIEKAMAISYFIASSIEKEFDVEIPEAEIKYIHQYLVCSGIQSDFIHLDADNYALEIDDEYMELINQLISIVSESVHYDLTKDKELKLSLITHFAPLIQRVIYDVHMDNPLVTEIKTQYAAMFSIVTISLEMLQNELLSGLSDNEIGFLTIHFQAAVERSMEQKQIIIVCPEGIGFSRLLSHRIERYISSVNIVDIVGLNKLSTMDLSGIDLVISTVPIKKCAKPVVLVSSFMSEMDIRDINNFLVQSGQSSEHPSLEHLSKIIDDTVVFTNLDYDNKKDVLSFIIKEMCKNGYVTRNYEKTVFDREDIMSTDLGNMIAIPHGSEKEIIESRLAIVTLKKPILWDKHEVSVVFLIAMTMDNPQKTKNILKDLYSIMDSKTMLQNIIDAKDVEEVIDLIHNN